MEIDLTLTEPPNFDLFDEELASEKAAKIKALSFATKSRTLIRRAKSEAALSEILPPTIAEGDAWHVLTSGDIDSLSFLAHIVRTTPLDYVAFSTWCMANADVQQIAAWLDAKLIKRCDAYVGEIFPGQYAEAHVALCSALRKHGGRVCVFRNHSKIYLCRAGTSAWVVESSANINTNPRLENTVITASRELYDHHLAYLSGVRSFARDFDDWSPP